jgi:hypothetical protein
MNNICPDIIYEIVKWLPEKDFLNARLVWRDIIDDSIPSLGKYMKYLISQGNIYNELIEKFIWHPDVLKMHELIGEKININKIETQEIMFKFRDANIFDKQISDVITGDIVYIYDEHKITKDVVTKITLSCAYCLPVRSDRYSFHLGYKKLLHYVYDIDFANFNHITILFPSDHYHDHYYYGRFVIDNKRKYDGIDEDMYEYKNMNDEYVETDIQN